VGKPDRSEYAGQRLDLMPAGYQEATNHARLLSFFTIRSDTHLTDKESPAQGLYYGWSAPFGQGGCRSLFAGDSLYDRTCSTPPSKAVNALHRQTPFDCGIFLGDAINNSQFNELRWYIDVIDGQRITPSSGAHRAPKPSADQKPYQASALDPSIPWYQVIGNHDQFWSGVNFINPKLLNALVVHEHHRHGNEQRRLGGGRFDGAYMGAVDGATVYGDIIGRRTHELVCVAPDGRRRSEPALPGNDELPEPELDE